jgi:hypothetical protein
MRYVYLVAFIAGLLLAVRLMFFGAERRRRRPGIIPLRRSEPAAVGFLVMFGVAGYLVTRYGTLSAWPAVGTAIVLGAVWAAIVARLAIAMARVTPEHDPDDPRFRLQGHVGVVTASIPAGGVGEIAWVDASGPRTATARAIDDGPIEAGLEICIERIDDGVALVELWSLVEARL